jgi:hypothetical protein
MSGVRALSQIRRVLLVAAACALAACGERQPTAPTETPAASSLLGLPTAGPTLVSCPTTITQSTSDTFGPLGGTLSLDGSSVFLPLGALLEPTKIELTIPASKYMEIGVRANDAEHFLFEQPILITIDYSRCDRTDLLYKPLSVWQIDPETKTLIEKMTVVLDNKLTRQITFTTIHLSGYAIAF